LLIRGLVRNDGKLSNRARKREFEKLTDTEIRAIEEKYAELFSCRFRILPEGAVDD
jgi:hypothetical protein